MCGCNLENFDIKILNSSSCDITLLCYFMSHHQPTNHPPSYTRERHLTHSSRDKFIVYLSCGENITRERRRGITKAAGGGKYGGNLLKVETAKIPVKLYFARSCRRLAVNL